MRQVSIVGAGPIGLEAALGARERGFPVTLLERAPHPGASLRRWGPTRFFSPLGMNLSARAKRALGAACPPDEALLTGPEMAERVLEPLARAAEAAGAKLRFGCRVVAIGRARLGRGDLAGHPLRGERPFRILIERDGGDELLEADRVLDASGSYGQPLPFGAGGLPAPGERAPEVAARTVRELGQLERELPALAGHRVLLVGHGHSAAHAAARLDGLAREAPSTRITWAVRTPNLRPCVEVADDPLPERRLVVERANALAAEPPPHLTVERRAHVESVAPGEVARFRVMLSGGRVVDCDAIVALCGSRPDHSFSAELPLEISPISEGAARLYRAVGMVTDCLSVPRVTPDDLASGEPGFHLVGAKSYGRLRTFLLGTGLGQLETILDRL
jgi:hypothetical protein